jgi:hypothetical protein
MAWRSVKVIVNIAEGCQILRSKTKNQETGYGILKWDGEVEDGIDDGSSSYGQASDPGLYENVENVVMVDTWCWALLQLFWSYTE